ncbi:MAG: hypothetical protein ACRENP_07980 [Longimicrobiales bacterium]
MLLQIPELARPVGFEIYPKFGFGGKILHPDETQRASDVQAHSIELMVAAPTWAIAGEGRDCIHISFNRPLEGEAGSSLWTDEQKRRIYTDQKRGKPMRFATEVYGSFHESADEPGNVNVLLTSGGELPWRNITRDEYYDSVIFWGIGKGGARLAEYRRQLQKTPYQEWLDGAAKRKQERDDLFKTLAGSVPAAELAQMRKAAEDTEREVGESLKKSEPDDRAANQKAWAESAWMSDSINAERRRQTPAQLRLPALTGGDDDRLSASGRWLTDRDAPDVIRILTPNYDFWRARRSTTEVRSIEVQFQGIGTCAYPAVKKAFWAAYQKLDWDTINRMLDVPRSR